MESLRSSPTQHTYTSLSIQVRLDGLSFFTQNPETKKVGAYDVVRFRESVNPANLLPQIETTFKSHPALSKQFEEVTVIYDNDLYTVVPSELFDSTKVSDYLKFNTKILNTDFVAYDHLKEQGKVVVYIPYANVNNYFFDHYGSFSYYHGTTLLLKKLNTQAPDLPTTKAFAQIKKDAFDLVVVSQNSVQLVNTFRITAVEDVLYFLLFTFEQLGLDPNEVPLELSGAITQDSDLFKRVYSYVRHCSVLPHSSTLIPKEDALLATLL